MAPKLLCANPALPRKQPTTKYGYCGIGRCRDCEYADPGPVVALEHLSKGISDAAKKALDLMLKRAVKDTRTFDRIAAVPKQDDIWFTTMDAARAWGISGVAARAWLYARSAKKQLIRKRVKKDGRGMSRDMWRVNPDPSVWVFKAEVRRQIRSGEAA